MKTKLSLVCFITGEEPGNFDYIIVNDDLDRAYTEFKKAISEVRLFFN